MDLKKNHWLATLVKSKLGWSESMAPCEKTFRDGGSSTKKATGPRRGHSSCFQGWGGGTSQAWKVGWLVGYVGWQTNRVCKNPGLKPFDIREKKTDWPQQGWEKTRVEGGFQVGCLKNSFHVVSWFQVQKLDPFLASNLQCTLGQRIYIIVVKRKGETSCFTNHWET